MAHESFEDETVAEQLNRDFVSIKVDREERPDIDGVYMKVCEAMTGSGGWPTSIFMDADGTPFFAGTYFLKGVFLQMLDAITEAWQNDRVALLQSGRRIADAIQRETPQSGAQDDAPVREALTAFGRSFDPKYGGFGGAPKFPSPHNLMFLLGTAPQMAHKTLECMYRGGIFDHIGGGFSRYSTDPYWLVPHFEKMLYDNALLAMTYLLGYEENSRELYRTVVERIFEYLERELRASGGGFFSAQDADADGVEGQFYLFTPIELKTLLGKEDGTRFCRRYDITPGGNFEGGSIPNLLHSAKPDPEVDALIPRVYEYRARRVAPQIDTKQLTAWNALTAAAYAMAGRILQDAHHLAVARETIAFIERELTEKNNVFVGVTDGKRSAPGFLDDYAFYLFALIQMHQATQEDAFLHRAVTLANRAFELFEDEAGGGFFFSGTGNETLIHRPKETWDGAMPSGNSMMAYNLSRLSLLTEDQTFLERAEKQRRFLNAQAAEYPMGYGFFLWSTLPVKKIVCVPQDPADVHALRIASNWVFCVTDDPAYPPVNGKTTYYVCENGTCRPPVNELS